MKKNIIYTIILLLVLSCASLSNSSNELSWEEKQILSVISKLRKNPISSNSKSNYSKVIKYATNADNITVTISPQTCPWIGKVDNELWSSYLLAAYIAGSIEWQVLNGINDDNKKPGQDFVLEVYKVMKEADSSFISKEIEEFE